mmetsp:Transcript_117871/g.263503  ORF Transcript_117871/g.263503 Transcript_117871/m.263503 type:complete len:787 (-) Transcript_117871:38-2398(-)
MHHTSSAETARTQESGVTDDNRSTESPRGFQDYLWTELRGLHERVCAEQERVANELVEEGRMAEADIPNKKSSKSLCGGSMDVMMLGTSTSNLPERDSLMKRRPSPIMSKQDAIKGSEAQTKFRLSKVWQDEMFEADSGKSWWLKTSNRNFCENRSNYTAATMLSELIGAETSCEKRVGKACRYTTVHPNSKVRLAWDIMGMLFIGYDIVFIPLQIFNMEKTSVLAFMDMTLILFWTCDLFLNFIVGYHHGGILVLNFLKIAKRYLRTWFVLDIILVSSEWLLVVIDGLDEEGESSGADGMESLGLARLTKTVRFLRLLRLFRLLRLMKLPKYLMRIEEQIQSEVAVVLIGITKLTFCILIINHIIACIWYGIGTVEASKPEDSTWLQVAGISDNTSLGYRYCTSLHWSLTQFTPASMEVYPVNEMERWFSVFVLVFALVTFSSFVSSITNAMTQLRNMNSEYAKQLLVFQRYLRYHKISTPLAVRMRRHLEHRLLRNQRHIEEKDVSLLQVLSEPLLMELHAEVYRPLLDHHPFFKVFAERNSSGNRKLCHSVITEVSLSQGDLLFTVGDRSHSMFVIWGGCLDYASSQANSSSFAFVRQGEWLCEGCLWTHWISCGEVHAKTRATIVCISAKNLHDVAKHCRSLSMRPARYGELFVEYLNSLHEHELTDLEDEDFDMNGAVEASCTGEDYAGLGTTSDALLSPTGSMSPTSLPSSPRRPSNHHRASRTSSKGSNSKKSDVWHSERSERSGRGTSKETAASAAALKVFQEAEELEGHCSSTTLNL